MSDPVRPVLWEPKVPEKKMAWVLKLNQEPWVVFTNYHKLLPTLELKWQAFILILKNKWRDCWCIQAVLNTFWEWSLLNHFPFDPVCFGATAGSRVSGSEYMHPSQGKSVPQKQGLSASWGFPLHPLNNSRKSSWSPFKQGHWVPSVWSSP